MMEEACALEATPSSLVKAAAKGHDDLVREMLANKPELVRDVSLPLTLF